jgi:predicted nucleic acid-binding protein
MEEAALARRIEMTIFFIDSNVFIYSQVSNLAESDLAKTKLEELRNKGEIAVNAIIVSECFHILARFIGPKDAAKRIGLFLESSKVLYLPIEKSTITRAIQLAVTLNQKINDMIIAQHAIDAKADGLLTDNSRHFKGIPNLAVRKMR